MARYQTHIAGISRLDCRAARRGYDSVSWPRLARGVPRAVDIGSRISVGKAAPCIR